MPPILRVSLDERGAGGRVKEQQQWEQQYGTWGSEQGRGAEQGGKATGMEAADAEQWPEQPSPLLFTETSTTTGPPSGESMLFL